MIDKDGHEWVTLERAWSLCGLLPASFRSFRNKVDRGDDGMIKGKFQGAVMVRKDSLPQVEAIKSTG